MPHYARMPGLAYYAGIYNVDRPSTGPGQLSASQVAQLSSAVVTAVSQAFSSVNGAQGQAEQSECSFSVGRPDATRSLTGTSSNISAQT